MTKPAPETPATAPAPALEAAKNSDADAPNAADNAAQPRKNAPRGRGRPFQPGNAGRPKGARNKTTLAVESLLEGEAGKITRKAIKMALAGDATALRLCMERIAPVRRGRRVHFTLPPIANTGDVVGALAAIAAAVSGGQISPAEAVEVAGVVELQRKAIETQEIEARLRAMEARFQ